ncbi:MAG TPA: serine/threonine-protein kinase [Jatrophihabitans sp.]|jgi:tRNA A-37 threonylcarbamoyl transferase component Bud32|uniref:serine/threonine-protein kinase n=1 Tax=Jatrophihabitans sp. TaxID=1932789 RepID=UPI002DFA575E|nr:serine/threonine-protein kinase [Jatrophihabitans sp.]
MPFPSERTPDDPTIGDATAAIPVSARGGSPSGWRVGDRYRVVDRLGAGGMADVFRAHDELLARDVAVKVFRAQPQAPETQTSANRQLAELHALARLNHPNLITLFDGSITDADGPAYLVMELVDGATLADRIAEGPLPADEARELGAQIAAALAYVHAQGMVHRDVKPANILLGVDRTDDGGTLRARLSDFGIVRLLGTERMTSVDFTLGTASYLAPEQARGADVGPPADVYSLGLVLIEALSGVRSFDGTPLEAALARLERDPEIPADLSPAWTALLVAMTAREPLARPSATQVMQLLRDDAAATSAVLGDADGATQALRIPGAALAGAAVGAGLATGYEDDAFDDAYGTSRPHAGRGRTMAWIAAAAVALAAIVLGAVMVLRPSTPADSQTPGNAPAANTPSSGAAKGTATKGNPGGVSPVSVESTKPKASRSASSSASSSASTSAAATTPAPASASSVAPQPAATTPPAAPSSTAPATTTAPAAVSSTPAGSSAAASGAAATSTAAAIAAPSGP